MKAGTNYRMKRILEAVFAAALMAAGVPSGLSAEDKTDPALEREIRRLGASDFKERETATEALVRRGAEAVPALLKALGSADLEIRSRSQVVLEKMGWPSKALLEKAGGLPPEVLRPALFTALKIPAPVEAQTEGREKPTMDQQDTAFAAVDLLARQPRDAVLSGLDGILKDPSASKYYAIRLLGKIGGAEARERLKPIAEQESPVAWTAAALLYPLGDKEPCERLIERWQGELKQCPANDPREALDSYNLACTLALSGREKDAYPLLEKALKSGVPGCDAAWIAEDPDFHEIRRTERFRKLLGQAGE